MHTQANDDYVPFVRLGRGLEYPLIIQRGRGRNAEFIAGVHFADKPTRRELRQWRDAIQRGMEPNNTGERPETRWRRSARRRGCRFSTSGGRGGSGGSARR